MSISFKFLAHNSFQQNIAAFLKKNSSFKKALFVNLEKARSNPYSGKQMHSLPKKLRQKVFRLRIGGPKDFRLIYYVDKNNKLVVGIFISILPRPKFSYDKGDWLITLEAISKDLEGQKWDNFSILNTEAAVENLK